MYRHHYIILSLLFALTLSAMALVLFTLPYETDDMLPTLAFIDGGIMPISVIAES